MSTSIAGSTPLQTVGAGVASGVGRVVLAPALSAMMDAPETQAAIQRSALTAGLTLGACIAGGIILGLWLGRR